MLSFLSASVHCADNLPIKTWQSTIDTLEEQLLLIDQLLPQPKVLNDCSFRSDVLFSQQEFNDTCRLLKKMNIDGVQLKKAIKNIFKKNKFESIELKLQEIDNESISINVAVQAYWTFERLKIKGLWTGKEQFWKLYLLEPGDKFDDKKHVHSVEKIESYLRQQGYFNAKIDSQLIKNEQTKTVQVELSIVHNDLFMIRNISIDIIKLDDSNNSIEYEELRSQANYFLSKKLNKKIYNKQVINTQAREFKTYLISQGYLAPEIKLSEAIVNANNCVDLHFTIGIHNKRKFVFFGNRFFSSEKLLEHIIAYGRSAGLVPAEILADEIKSAYKNNGFWNVEVQVKEEDDRSFFIINEGTRAIIKNVVFIGDMVLHSDELQSVFTDVLEPLFYESHEFKKALSGVTSMFLKEGFLDMRVIKTGFEELEPGFYHSVITIDQGERSYITEIQIPNEPELCNNPELRIISEELIPATVSHIAKQRDFLTQYYTQQGYENSTVVPCVKKNGTQVSIKWDIQHTQKPTRFGTTIIEGSLSFPQEYILRELLYIKGDLWDASKLSRSLLQLKKLEIFEHISLFPDQETLDNEKNIILKLYLDEPYEVRLRGGLAIQQVGKQYSFNGVTYKAGGTFLYKNPTNHADLFWVDADYTRLYHSVVFKHRLPWIFNMPIKTVFQGYIVKAKYPGIVKGLDNLYQVTQEGFLVATTRKWNHVEWSCNVGAELMETTASSESFVSPEQIAQAIGFTPLLLDQKIPFFLFEPNFFLDYLDKPLDPQYGSLTVASIKCMLPLKRISQDSSFVKCMFEQSFFMPIKKAVLAFRFRGGHIFYQQFSSIMPSERFYLGGANSIRSYQPDLCPPLGAITNENGEVQFVPQGSRTMLNINAEVRFGLWNKISGVLFQDLGALSNNWFADLTPQNVLLGTGFGIRYNTPVGPVRFDFGYKWRSPDQSIASYAWFITVGQAF